MGCVRNPKAGRDSSRLGRRYKFRRREDVRSVIRSFQERDLTRENWFSFLGHRLIGRRSSFSHATSPLTGRRNKANTRSTFADESYGLIYRTSRNVLEIFA